MALTEISGSFSQNFYYFFLPFIFIFAIFYGILSIAKVFSKRVNLIISILISLSLAPTEFYPFLTNYLLRLGAWVTIIAFGILFIVGVSLVTVRKGKEIYRKTLNPSERLKQIEKEIKKVDEKIWKARQRGNVKEEEKNWLERERLERERLLLMREIEREVKLRKRF